MTLAMVAAERRSKEPGRLSKAVTRLLMRRATVTANERLADRFHLITLEGAALKGVAWLPGQKVQIAMGSAFVTRTYTPIEWNPEAGRACILGYVHGDGPGSAWVRGVGPGEDCDLFGPRASLDLSRLANPLVIIGDETAIGLAYAAVHQDTARRVTACFEVADAAAVRQVTNNLGLHDAVLIERCADDAHVALLNAVLSDSINAGACVALTGKAATIQKLRQSAMHRSISPGHLVTKAYWAAGKKGLD